MRNNIIFVEYPCPGALNSSDSQYFYLLHHLIDRNHKQSSVGEAVSCQSGKVNSTDNLFSLNMKMTFPQSGGKEK